MARTEPPVASAIEVVWHYVRDVAATAAWYRRVFGFEFEQHGDDWAETSLAGVRFAFHRGDDVRPGTTNVDFLVDDIEAAAETLRSRGADVGEIQQLPHGAYARIVDPDGYAVEIFERA